MHLDLAAALADARSEYDKMVAGDWYRYRFGPELADLTTATQRTCRRITALYDDDRDAAAALFRELLGTVGDGVDFRPPFYLDYGHRLHVGDRTFINADFLTLGGGEIRIGADVLIGPSVRLYTPTHVLDPELRPQGWERVSPITIEDGVWLGGSVVVCPGVTIGARSVIGAGSVVTKDVPPDVVAAGNPARVVRRLDGSPA
ncbi:sugar O-acetyltransferase [Cellulomonas persica]|uniref:Maltose O-acetyltransferase n=1 Tax=Cellulomonas persica TaxID=76861 RepID=A0A510URQ8_9CELL|nr:sugar O-acetyltransferase [Cellulomonas persica]GEK17348.1 maltose O-acetyltransferase [Cellulomonas persica]